MGDLKPCAHCGGNARLVQRNPVAMKLWHVQCDNCDSSQAGALSEEGAIAAWNRRSTHTGGEADLRNDIARVAEGVIWKHSDADAFQAQKCAAMIVEAVLEILQPQGGR